ncbi:hypothetical protein GCM10010517_62880 [Streptosporangium fragile]
MEFLKLESRKPIVGTSEDDHFIIDELQKPTLAIITMHDDIVFPWDDTKWFYIDLADDGEYKLTFYFITLLASEEESLLRICEPIVRRQGLKLHHVSETSEGLSSSYDFEAARSWAVACIGSLPELTFGDINALRRELSYSAFFSDHTLIHPELIVSLLQSGSASRLIEKPESQTLEVKSSAYELKQDPYWKIRLAQDVASFANSEKGGILIVGIQTKKDARGKDVINKITPIPPDKSRIQKYANIINDRIHPPIDGIRIDTVAEGRGDLLYILIPAQREEQKPFIVQGAAIDGNVEGFSFSIPRRRGDNTMWLQGKDLHTMIAVGRTFLRTGRIDRNEENLTSGE